MLITHNLKILDDSNLAAEKMIIRQLIFFVVHSPENKRRAGVCVLIDEPWKKLLTAMAQFDTASSKLSFLN